MPSGLCVGVGDATSTNVCIEISALTFMCKIAISVGGLKTLIALGGNEGGPGQGFTKGTEQTNIRKPAVRRKDKIEGNVTRLQPESIPRLFAHSPFPWHCSWGHSFSSQQLPGSGASPLWGLGSCGSSMQHSHTCSRLFMVHFC